jgi:CheY-like chemotaxis protein/predicted RNA-binding Zn-ribbon protein involved in translation (DUF1610 family)
MSHILFLSSDPVLKEKNLEILHQNGLEADGASEGLEGLIMLDKNGFDIVVIDDELTDISGFEACVKVRQQSDVHIILLGTVAETEVWSKVEELGFDLYLKKPISPRELLARIKALLRRPGTEKKSGNGDKQAARVAITRENTDAGHVAQAQNQPAQRPMESQPKVSSVPQQATVPSYNSAQAQAQPRQIFSQQPTADSQPAQPQAQVPQFQSAPFQAESTQPRQSQQQVPQQPVFSQPSADTSQPAQQRAQVPQFPSMPFQPEPAQPRQPQPQVPQQPAFSTPSSPVQRQSAEPLVQQPVQPVTAEPAVPTAKSPEPFVVPPMEQPKNAAPQAVAQPAQKSAAQPPAAQPQKIQPVYFPDDSGTNVLDDARTVKLVEALVSGKLTDINPVIDFNYKLGFAYPAVDSLLDTTDQETLNILDDLAANGILIKEPYEKFYIDPENMFQLVPTERCPHCDSGEITRGQLVEHFSCGYVGLDKDFKQDSRYICPKCRKDLRLIGTDYRNIGMHYRCQDCNEVFTTPVVKWRNLKTRKVWNAEELREVEVYAYRFSPDKRGWLEFQLKPKTQLVDFLRSRGYQVQELAQMTGRSGAVHTVDVLAIRDDIITKINLGIGLLVANTGEPEVGLEALFKYDTRTYDIGINYKVVIVIPKLGAEAMNFANRQMIRAFEAKTLASVVTNITNLPGLPVNLQKDIEPTSNMDAQGNARVMLVKFLRNRGYDVYERALVAGKSGIEHVFDIFARRDDRIIVPTLAIGIAVSSNNSSIELDEVSRFDAAAFDCGIRNKVFIGIPYISMQAKQFARQQRIDVFEQQDLSRIA